MNTKKLEEIKKLLGMSEQKNEEQVEIKSGEAMSTMDGGVTAPSDMSTSIIEKLREQKNFSSYFPAPINMPTSEYKLPIEGEDPIFYYTGENGDVPSSEYANSKARMMNTSLSAKKFTAITYLSGELDEDGIVAMRPLVEGKIVKQYAETLDKVLINGDTNDTDANINGTQSTSSQLLAHDGLRATALMSGNTVDAGALDLGDIRDLRAKLGNKGLNPNELVLGVGTDVFYKLLSVTQAETVEKFGSAATVVNGTIKAIDGIEVVASGFFPKADVDGKVKDDNTKNITGTGVLVYKQDVVRGIRRDLKTTVEYLPERDQFRISAHFRYAQNILINPMSDFGVAALINVTI